MDKKIIREITGKNAGAVYLQSLNGKAVILAGSDLTRGVSLVSLGAEYSGSAKAVSRNDLRSVKSSLELADVSRITEDGEYLMFGNIELRAAETDAPIDVSLMGKAPLESISLDTDTTAETVKLTEYASKDETRCFLNGVYFAVNGEIVATDGRRLGLYRTPAKFGGWIIHREVFGKFSKPKTLTIDVMRRSGGEDKNTLLRLSDGKKTVFAETINAVFPNYKRVIPDANERAEENKITFDYPKFKNYIKEVSGIKNLSNGKVVLYKRDIWCKDIKVGGLNFDLDMPIFMEASYLFDAVKDGGQIKWSERERFGDRNIKCVEKAVVFGTEQQMSVVMPFAFNDDILPESMREKGEN